jgi:hypothetical protein
MKKAVRKKKPDKAKMSNSTIDHFYNSVIYTDDNEYSNKD